MRKRTLAVTVLGVIGGAYVIYRSRLPLGERDRWARRLMNERIAPAMLDRGITGGGQHAAIGIVEHVGRKTGTLRQTLVHPTVLGDRVVIPLPYGDEGQWQQNVVAAGGCRLEFRGEIYSLCNPRSMSSTEIEGLPRSEAVIGKAFGNRFLVLDVVTVGGGDL